MKLSSLFLVLLLSLNAIAFADEKSGTAQDVQAKKETAPPRPLPDAVMSQGDFARELVRVFGWDSGLSKEPKDRDYLQILEGRRTFKFEAEKIYNRKTDNVSERKNTLLGQFSGESWLWGVAVPSSIHMKLFIPLVGDYSLSAVAKGDGQKWKLSGKEFTANSGGSLALTKIGDIALKPGELEVEMLVPPEGGLDYIVFSAPDFAPVEPIEGWRFGETLTNSTMAQVASSLLGLEGELPLDESVKPISIIVSEMGGLPSSVKLSDIKYSGKFSGKYWVSTSAKSADLDIPFTIPQSGTYGIKVRFMGKSFSGSIDGNPLMLPAKPYLEWLNLGLHRFSGGKHSLKLTIPPYGGIDSVVIEAKKSSPEAYMALTGMSGNPASSVTYAEMEKYLIQLKERFKGRK